MNQKKIGEYIANKRKTLGLTQAQVAERLGMSNKSVSKWERGVCLPDVSVYASLCEVLGITINEFLAGEDIEPAQVASKSEENIIKVSRFAKVRGRFFKKIIAVLAVVMLLLATIIGGFIIKEGYLDTNYVQGSTSKSNDRLASMIGGSEGTSLFEYKINEGFGEVYLEVEVYKDGKKAPALGFAAPISDRQDRKGYLVVAPNLTDGSIKAGVLTDSGSGSMESDSLASLKEYGQQSGGASAIVSRKKITKGEPMELAVFYYEKKTGGSTNISFEDDGHYKPLAKGVTLIVKCTFK